MEYFIGFLGFVLNGAIFVASALVLVAFVGFLYSVFQDIKYFNTKEDVGEGGTR